MTKRQNELISLHKYWMFANRMAMIFKGTRKDMAKTLQDEAFIKLPDVIKTQSVFLSDFGIFKAFWYSSLYSVIEGYKDLKITCTEMDELMNEDFIDGLRLFRNATFHYQKNNYSEKLFKVDMSNEFTNWVYDFHYKIGNCIVENMETDLGEEISETIFNSIDDLLGYNFKENIFENDRKS